MNQPITTALRLARHPVNDLERYELGGEMIPHLRPGENVDTGALRILADRVEWLEGEAEQCRVSLKDVAAGRVDSRLRQERVALAASAARLRSTLDAYKASGRMLEEKVANLTAERDALRDRVNRAEERANACGLQAIALAGELAEARAENQEQWRRADYAEKHLGELAKFVGKVGENWAGVVSESMSSIDHANTVIARLTSRLEDARAENGRQAATIAAMRGAGKVRIETPHTGRDNRHHFRDWMEGDSPQSHPNHRS